MKNINLKGVSKATWVRILGLLFILINQVATSVFNTQLLPFTDAEIYEGISTVLTIVISVYTAWKNNSLTEEAQYADSVLKLKKEDKQHG